MAKKIIETGGEEYINKVGLYMWEAGEEAIQVAVNPHDSPPKQRHASFTMHHEQGGGSMCLWIRAFMSQA